MKLAEAMEEDNEDNAVEAIDLIEFTLSMQRLDQTVLLTEQTDSHA